MQVNQWSSVGTAIAAAVLQEFHNHTFVVCLFGFLLLCIVAQTTISIAALPLRAVKGLLVVIGSVRSSKDQALATLQTSIERLAVDVQAVRMLGDNITLAATTGVARNNDILTERYAKLLQEAAQGIVEATVHVVRDIDYGYGPSGSGRNPRYFYVGYTYTIDHDHSAKEFQIPGLETIAKGVVTRHGFTVVEAGDGIFRPLLIRQMLMQRHAASLLASNGGSADAICMQYNGANTDTAAAVGNVDFDGNVTVSDVLDVVVDCVQEMSRQELQAHKLFADQIRISGIKPQ